MDTKADLIADIAERSGISKAQAGARPAFQKMLSRDLAIEATVHEMRGPTRYEGRYGTPLSTLPEILRESDLDSKQS